MKIPTPVVRSTFLAASTLALLAFCVVALAEDDGYTGGNTKVTTGPDVTVWEIPSTRNWTGSSPDGGIRAYSIATDSCNIGSVSLKWCNPDYRDCVSEPEVTGADHPVIAQNLYRLHDGRFRQLGKNWLKHGFNALNTQVGTSCVGNQGDGNPTAGCTDTGSDGFLHVGCTDLYSATTNGSQSWAGPRSEVNGATGDFSYPPVLAGDTDTIDQRIQVQDTDLIESAGSTAKYWIEAHYVTPDDAMAGNGLNNASYREVTVGSAPSKGLTVTGDTVREAAAIWAWKAEDPTVEIQRVDLPSTPVERFHVATKVVESSLRGDPSWHVEVVVHNMNSDRSARALQITFPTGTIFSNPEFFDVDSHSGEVYSSVDWSWDNSTPHIARWETDDFATDEDANAIRWGTAYTFAFDVDTPPTASLWELELFKPGSPTFVTIPFGRFFEDGFESADTSKWSATVP